MNPPIRNIRLRIRLLRARHASRPSPSEKSPSPVRLLGEGLDALICKTRLPETSWVWRLLNPSGTQRKLVQPSPQARLDRYHDAAAMFDPRTEHERLRRAALGFEFREFVRSHRSTYARRLGLPAGRNVIPFHRASRG